MYLCKNKVVVAEIMASIPTVTFNNGNSYPILGLGTCQYKSGEVTAAIEYAIDLGYRHFDCAYVYQNEKEVGLAIANKIAQGVVKREDLYITSKLWNTFHHPDAVENALKQSLQNLGLTYLDLYLIHWPFAFQESLDSEIIFEEDIDYADTWKAIEDLQRQGLVKSIGVCNFNRRQIERLLRIATISPVVNQIECHPYLNQKKLVDFCRARGILITAYFPLGSSREKLTEPQLLDDAKLKQIANKYNKTPVQIVLKYQVQRGNITLVPSLAKSDIEESVHIFDFELSDEDVKCISKFECKGRICRFESVKDHLYYPFNDEY